MIDINLRRVKKIIFTISLLLFSTMAHSIDDPYRAEIGAETGVNIYLGDLNGVGDLSGMMSNFKNIKSESGIFFKYRLDERFALRLGYNYSRIGGNYSYLNGTERSIEQINNQLHNVDIWGEYNFFEINSNPYKRFAKQFSPFILAGIGASYTTEHPDSKPVKLSIPIGVGVKIKLAERWNVGVKWVHQIFLSDDLEGVAKWNNPTPKNISNPMNGDKISGISISVSFDFWERECDCK